MQSETDEYSEEVCNERTEDKEGKPKLTLWGYIAPGKIRKLSSEQKKQEISVVSLLLKG